MSGTSRQATDGCHDTALISASDREQPSLRIVLLGAFQVTVGERVIADDHWRLRKAKTLVKLLALTPHGVLHRDELLDLLWPELDPAAATNNLRYALHVARRVLEPQSGGVRRCLRWQGERLALAPDSALEIDVDLFEAAALAARGSEEPNAFQQAVDLYTGDLLPEDRYEDWAAGRREILRETYLGLLLDLARLREATLEYRQAIDVLRTVIAVESSREDAHAALMRAYAATGQRRLALRQYDYLCDVLRADLDAEPDLNTQHLYAELLAGHSPSDDQTIVSATGVAVVTQPSHNLPVALTSFVGRQRELAELGALLMKTRLLTINGVGGSGKTRLALELAGERLNAYPDGVWLVELAALTDGALVVQALAKAVGVQEEPGHPLLETIAGTLRGARMLLILDNCEHVVQACADVSTRILTVCPEVRLLATSREALAVPGEVVWAAPPLSLPPQIGPTAQPLLDAESAQLFVERARYRHPAFELTQDNAPAIAEICRRVEGNPLAIELAAARVAVLSAVEIAARLDDALGLLVSGGRLTPARHRSLRGVLDWSYRLLSEPEQALLARLAVFAGGCTLGSVEEVTTDPRRGPEQLRATDTLDLVSHLVDKSLVVVEAGTGGVTRYNLLATVRQYAWERLRERREEERLRERHALYCLALAEMADPELTGPGAVDWLARLEREHDNLRAALDWAIEAERVEVEARLCALLWRFWYFHGHLIEGERWLTGVLSRSTGAAVPGVVRGRLLQGAGALAWNRGDLGRSEGLSRQALALFEEAGELPRVAATLHNLGLVAEQRGDLVEAVDCYAASLRLREEQGDTAGAAMSLQALGGVARMQNDLKQAVALHQRSLAYERQAGNKRGIAIALTCLGVVAIDEGDYPRAVELCEESIRLHQELGDTSLIANSLTNLASAVLFQGDPERALKLQATSLRLARDAGDARGIAFGLEGVAAALALRQTGEHSAQEAARLYGAADMLRAGQNLPLLPPDRAWNERSLTAILARLDTADFDVAFEAGKALPRDMAVAAALAVVEREQAAIPAPSSLSRREQEVAVLVTRGLTNRQIAAELGMANRTADAHVGNVLRKLGVSSRAQVRDWTIAHGLTSTDER